MLKQGQSKEKARLKAGKENIHFKKETYILPFPRPQAMPATNVKIKSTPLLCPSSLLVLS